MTIGENIRNHIINSGISEEELAQQLLVSPETIRMWENDQTLPTTEDLIKLRKIFGIFSDDLPGCEKQEEPRRTVLPSEHYRFRFTKQELRSLHRISLTDVLLRLIIISALCAVMSTANLTISGKTISITPVIIGAVCIIIPLFIKALIAVTKTWKKNYEKIPRCTYKYNLYNDYLMLNIERDGETMYVQKVYYDDIEKIQCTKDYIILYFSGHSVFIKQKELIPGSLFFDLIKSKNSKPYYTIPSTAWKVTSVLLVILSVSSIFLALPLISKLSSINHLNIENTWIFFAMTPIPVSSIIFGIILKKNGYRYKKNVICGTVMAILLCLYGCFSFISSTIFDYSDTVISQTEELLDIDIPEHVHIKTQDWTQGTQNVPWGYVISSTHIVIDESDTSKFAREIRRDSKWLPSLSNKLANIISPLYTWHTAANYHLIYNKNTGEYNTLPQKSGKYNFIMVSLDLETDSIYITDYEIVYTA